METQQMGLALCATLGLSSCGAVSRVIDRAGERTEQIIKEVTPQVVESVFNTDAVAFLIVSVVGLGIIVVLVALLLLIGTARAWWKRIQLEKCSTVE